MSDAADAVRRAANHIQKYGLHKGDFNAKGLHAEEGHGVPCCTMGAFSVADVGSTTENLFREYLRDTVGHPYIGDWNDAPERTADEVVTFLRGFADKLEAGDE